MRGKNVFPGYYKMPEATAEMLDAEGWLYSGDIAEIQPDGSFNIIDRKKNIFKLSQGEYIAPDKIEQICSLTPTIAEAFVFGSSNGSHICGIFVVDPPQLAKLAKEIGEEGDLAELVEKETIIQAVWE